MTGSNRPSDTSVIFVTIDSFRPDVLGINGDQPSPTPFLDRLFGEGYKLESCFSTGYPTQFALTGLKSSTLPLDYGGYTYGIRDRPTALAEIFAENGYQTGAFVSGGYIRRLYHFDRGFQTFCPTYPAYKWITLSGAYLKGGAKLIQSGEQSEMTVIRSLVPYLRNYLESFETYCRERQEEISNTDSHLQFLSPAIHDLEFDEMLALIEKEYDEFKRDPEAYTHRLLEMYPDNPFQESIQFDQDFSGDSNVDSQYRRKLKLFLLNTYLNPLSDVGLFASGIKDRTLVLGMMAINSYSGRWTSAGYVLQNLREWIRDSEEPFYSWVHLHDLHKKNRFSWEIDDETRHNEELTAHLDYLERVRETGSPYENALPYALAARYVDLTLERFVSEVSDELTEPPLVVITSDHGTSTLEDRSGDHVAQFYDELLHVPVAFSHPSLDSQSYEGLCSSIDIGPTLVEFLGLEVPDGFDGVPIQNLQPNGRDFVIAEDLGRGICDPYLKNPNVCIRSSDRKIICSVDVSAGVQLEVQSAYDLEHDATESEPRNTDDLHSDFDPLVDEGFRRIERIKDWLDK